jgi:spermidine synthase
MPSGSNTTSLPRYSIALLSASALGYEVLLMRLFSIIQWHHFAYMIISLALLGYGASGTFLSLFSQHLQRHFCKVYLTNILLFSLSTISCFLIAQQIPFNAEEILLDVNQSFYLLYIYLLLTLPFFFAANAIGLVFMKHRQHISQIYAADMIGAGLGSIAIIVLLFFLLPNEALRLLAVLGILVGVLACWELGVDGKTRLIFIPLLVLPLLLPTTWTTLNISPYKSLQQTMRITGTRIVAEYSSPLALLNIIESPDIPFRHAPGLSLNADIEPPKQIGIFSDADNMTVITENSGNKKDFRYLDYITSALPYHFRQLDDVLILGAGGGADVLQANYHEVANIDAVELNPQIVDLLRKNYALFSGQLYNQANAHFHIDEARGFVSASDKQFDLIQMAMFDSFSASAAGLYALSESYLYTVEAFQQYLSHLKTNGYLAISRWGKLPPRDTLKLLATAIAALKQNETIDIEKSIVLIRSWQTSTLIIKNGHFSKKEITALQNFCQQRSFDVAYYPGVSATEANIYNRLMQPYFYQGAKALIAEDSEHYFENYKFNLRPATDDRPYFFNFFKWSTLEEILELSGKGGLPLLEWGYLILIATLLQALVISFALIVLPLVIFKPEQQKSPLNGLGRLRTFAYFSLLGLAFLFIEIAYMQKFILFLHHPLYAIAVVLTSFLVFAGLGSNYSKRFAQHPRKGVMIAVSSISIISVIYLFSLTPIFNILISLPTVIKVLITIILIAPLAFYMGMPFPLGLSILRDKEHYLIPWAWGINGCASVLSAIIATLLALHFGFSLVIFTAFLFYCSAALLLIKKRH